MLVKRQELSEGTTCLINIPVGASEGEVSNGTCMFVIFCAWGGWTCFVSASSSTRIESLAWKPQSSSELFQFDVSSGTGGKPLRTFTRWTGIWVRMDSSDSKCSIVLESNKLDMIDCPPLCFTLRWTVAAMLKSILCLLEKLIRYSIS